MSGNAIEFVKRVGIVSAAALSVMALAGALWSFTAAHILRPEIQKLVEGERIARVASDSAIVYQLAEMSNDRLDIIAFLEAKNESERRARLAEIKRQWLERQVNPYIPPRLYGR